MSDIEDFGRAFRDPSNIGAELLGTGGVRGRIEFMRAGLGVRRYHQRYTAEIDTVGKHSAGVAGFLLLMNLGLPSAQLLAAAICHDLAESVTGDIPSPAKRAWSDQAKASLHEQEASLLMTHSLFQYLTDEEHRQLKVADNFDGLMFCIEERRRGNTQVDSVAETYIRYIGASDLRPAEVDIANILGKLWKELQ